MAGGICCSLAWQAQDRPGVSAGGNVEEADRSRSRVAGRHDGPGTYRSATGELVHVREIGSQHVIEMESPRSSPVASFDMPLVKLSDDPLWPDLVPADALGADRFD